MYVCMYTLINAIPCSRQPLTRERLQSLRIRHSLMINLLILFLGHKKLGLEVLGEVFHGFPHEPALPEVLGDSAYGGEFLRG